MPLAPGTQLGVYEVLALIGQGGMGEVYRAREAHLGRDVALKTLPEVFVSDPERVARFEREARILATLNHPNIATIFGFEKHAGVLALVMELVEGDTLHEHLERAQERGRGLPLPEVISIARQIVDALDTAHEKGIVHRDLKPANIKLTPDGLVKVLDFGLAKAVGAESGAQQAETRTLSPAETGAHTVIGTAAYMSPEQARGLPLDRRTDIWSFGCVLYEMLTGRPAFARGTSSDTIAAVLTGEVDRNAMPADVPPPMRQVVERCLERTWSADGADGLATVERPSVDERVAADLSFLIAFVRSQENLNFHGGQLPDPGSRLSEDELVLRARGNLSRHADDLGTGNALRYRELAGAAKIGSQPQRHQFVIVPYGARDDGAGG